MCKSARMRWTASKTCRAPMWRMRLWVRHARGKRRRKLSGYATIQSGRQARSVFAIRHLILPRPVIHAIGSPTTGMNQRAAIFVGLNAPNHHRSASLP